MNEDKKLKREKKKDKKIKKSTNKNNKSSGNKQILFKPLAGLNDLPIESITFEGQDELKKKPDDNDNSEDDEEDKPTDPSETQMLDSLTGLPYAEDELLFAIPVVAPYNALTNYK